VIISDTSKIDHIIQYSLFISSQEDDMIERSLGLIHFIKYVYLVDLEYAKQNDGKTFTGIDWIFYHFGPWSQEVHSRIEPALLSIGAIKENIPSSVFGREDFIRWHIDIDEDINLDGLLPFQVKMTLKNYVRQFKNDTSRLLHYVYATTPMLNATPKERLDFSLCKLEEKEDKSKFMPYLERISEIKHKELLIKIEDIRAKYQATKEKNKSLAVIKYRPRYDGVYEEGIEWLDSLSGIDFPEGESHVEFSDQIWKSKARRT